ncbi:MAG: 2-oxoglutarate oxidoreductase [Candidatus Aminicenantes bacterium]|nr:2-oxoglutarate oxidoreductase [Candidatus Aminicenantes bacterium]
MENQSLRKVPFHYCPGCGHLLIHRLLAQVIDEFNIRERVIGVAPVGCAVIAYKYWNFDVTESAHGRCLAVATGIKRILPDRIVFTYQGDGDLASIGIAETLHAANRGEKITTIFVNNAVYGMTGGQMAPTTILGQVTTTTPLGRRYEAGEGFPLKVCELLKSLDGVYSLERVSVHAPAAIQRAKEAIKEAFSHQIENKGFSLVEVISACPTGWHIGPQDTRAWIEKEMLKIYPLGKIK